MDMPRPAQKISREQRSHVVSLGSLFTQRVLTDSSIPNGATSTGNPTVGLPAAFKSAVYLPRGRDLLAEL